jgi:hypothetical protein
MNLRQRVRRHVPPDVRADLATAGPPWLVSRGLVAVAYVVARLAASEVDARPFQLSLGLFAWDGVWYRGIAAAGYDELPLEATRFFPLYPLAGRAVGWLFAGRAWLGLLVVANLGALAAAVVFRRLALHVTGDRAAAGRAVWLLLLSPASFVLVWAYSEGLFLVAAAGMLLALHRRAWWWAAGLGAAAALTRPMGVFLAAAALVAVLGFDDRQDRRARPQGAVAGRLAAVVGPLLGTAAYLLWVAQGAGDWRDPIDAQYALKGDFELPFTRLARGLGDVVGGDLAASLHVAVGLLFLGLVIVTFMKLPLSHAVYAAGVFLAATGSNTIASLERYLVGAFPVLVAAALLLRPPWLDRSVLSLASAALVGLAVLAWFGAYTP